jgi:hypothetical protein
VSKSVGWEFIVQVGRFAVLNSESLFWVLRYHLSSSEEGWVMEQILKRCVLGNCRLVVKAKKDNERYGRGEFFLEPKKLLKNACRLRELDLKR